MNLGVELEPTFSAALRAELVEVVTTRKSRRRLPFFVGAAVGVVALAGTGVATAAIFGLPGAPVSTPLAERIVAGGVGSSEVDLGVAPEGATHISVEFVCSGAGEFLIADIALTCDENEISPVRLFDLPIAVLTGTSIDVETSSPHGWQLAAAYINQVASPWAVNQNGETYGVANGVGSPDLVAVETTEGRFGYVRSEELALATGDPEAHDFASPSDALQWQEETRGTSVTIPVFESDGTTVVGEFLVER